MLDATVRAQDHIEVIHYTWDDQWRAIQHTSRTTGEGMTEAHEPKETEEITVKTWRTLGKRCSAEAAYD